MSGRGGIYKGPDGRDLHGDGQPVGNKYGDEYRTGFDITEEGLKVHVWRITPKTTPVVPRTFPCNSYGFVVDVSKMKIGWWTLLGLKAMNFIFGGYRLSIMDRWCYWKALTEDQQRRLVWKARNDRKFHCRECGRLWDYDEED